MAEAEKLVSESSNKIKPEIAGFWQRLFAFLIDTMIISIPFAVIGTLFTNFAVNLGPWGHTYTFIALIFYFAILDSKIGRGQSLGKRMMKIKVINQDGSFLTVQKALTRAILVVVIMMFNKWSPPLKGIIPVFISLSIFLGGFLALTYALIFNKKTRQGLHDLWTNTYTVNTSYQGGFLEATSVNYKRITYAFLGIGILIAAIFSFSARPSIVTNTKAYQSLDNIEANLLKNEKEINSINIHFVNHRSFSHGKETLSSQIVAALEVSKSCQASKKYCDDLIKKVATQILSQYKNVNAYTTLKIRVLYGYDLGLASGGYEVSESYSPEEWRSKLGINDIAVMSK